MGNIIQTIKIEIDIQLLTNKEVSIKTIEKFIKDKYGKCPTAMLKQFITGYYITQDDKIIGSTGKKIIGQKYIKAWNSYFGQKEEKPHEKEKVNYSTQTKEEKLCSFLKELDKVLTAPPYKMSMEQVEELRIKIGIKRKEMFKKLKDGYTLDCSDFVVPKNSRASFSTAFESDPFPQSLKVQPVKKSLKVQPVKKSLKSKTINKQYNKPKRQITNNIPAWVKDIPTKQEQSAISHVIYRFINSYGEIIYIGRAKNLENRLHGHNHLPRKCYKETVKIEFTRFKSEDDLDLAEPYYISKHKPKYNQDFKNKNYSFIILALEQKTWENYKYIEVIKKHLV